MRNWRGRWVCVEWLDSYSRAMHPWEMRGKPVKIDDRPIVTVGFCVLDHGPWLVIAASLAPHQYGEALRIPRGAVRRVHRLTLPVPT